MGHGILAWNVSLLLLLNLYCAIRLDISRAAFPPIIINTNSRWSPANNNHWIYI